jgi:hypothetical protein
MFARWVAVWGADKHFFNLRSASRGHFRSIPDERLSERNDEQDAQQRSRCSWALLAAGAMTLGCMAVVGHGWERVPPTICLAAP